MAVAVAAELVDVALSVELDEELTVGVEELTTTDDDETEEAELELDAAEEAETTEDAAAEELEEDEAGAEELEDDETTETTEDEVV